MKVLLSLLAIVVFAFSSACEQEAPVTTNAEIDRQPISGQQQESAETKSAAISPMPTRRNTSAAPRILVENSLENSNPVRNLREERRAQTLEARRWWNDRQFEDLDLDIEQKAAMENKLQAMLRQEEAFAGDRQYVHQQYHRAIQEGDMESLGSAMERQLDMRFQKQRLRVETTVQVLRLLTPEQRARLAQNPARIQNIIRKFRRGKD